MPEDNVVECIADAETLLDYVGVLDAVVDEARLHMNGDGFHASAVDPANICMIDYADLAPRAFEAYDAPGSVTIGFNLESFQDYLKPAGKNDLVELSVDMETRKLKIHYGATTHHMGLIDPDAIRKEPDTPDLDLPNTVVLEGNAFAHMVDVVQLSSDHVEVRGNTDDRQVEFAGQGDTDETLVEYGDGDVIDADVKADDVSLFSADWMENIVDPIPNDAEVTVTFGHEFPLRASWDGADGAMNVRMMLAPRIDTS